MRLLMVPGFIILNVLAVTELSQAYSCTISRYDEADIIKAVRDCNDITLNSISIPGGVTLNLNLQPGTRLTFQGNITWGFYEWKGPLLNITGSDVLIVGALNHVLDAKGALWWDGLGEHGGKIKPLFFVLHGMKNVIIRNIHVKNTPYHAISIENSENVIAMDVLIDNEDGDTQGGLNTQGFNVLTSTNVQLTRISVYNQDDCIDVISGTYILIRDIYCYGGYGLTIGSVGSRSYSSVENVLLSNCEIENSDNGIRIKTIYQTFGSVTNIMYENIVLKDIKNYGIVIEGDIDINTGEPTGIATDGVPIDNLILLNVTGTVEKSGVNVYVLVNNASKWSWFDVVVTGGEVRKQCDGIPDGSGITC